ncbi:MAG: MoaD/ThiS family protein [Methylococcales bacterium]|nr:MoaD/ThiS family protein [Methylococcales bacterium]
MSIKIRYFASLKDYIGRSEDEIIYNEVLTVTEVWQQATQNKVKPQNTLVSVNMDYVNWDEPVSDRDEVAFFPPVTGG